MTRTTLAFLLLSAPAWAGDLKIGKAMIPLAPPGAMAHAAFLSITNDGDTTRHLVGVRAEGYAMAHIHRSEVTDGVATMSSVDMVEIAPGQTIAFEHGGLHVMLMKPQAPAREGDVVGLTLLFADGSTEPFDATVMRIGHGSHGS